MKKDFRPADGMANFDTLDEAVLNLKKAIWDLYGHWGFKGALPPVLDKLVSRTIQDAQEEVEKRIKGG